jgi:hypothetical protein
MAHATARIEDHRWAQADEREPIKHAPRNLTIEKLRVCHVAASLELKSNMIAVDGQRRRAV